MFGIGNLLAFKVKCSRCENIYEVPVEDIEKFIYRGILQGVEIVSDCPSCNLKNYIDINVRREE